MGGELVIIRGLDWFLVIEAHLFLMEGNLCLVMGVLGGVNEGKEEVVVGFGFGGEAILGEVNFDI